MKHNKLLIQVLFITTLFIKLHITAKYNKFIYTNKNHSTVISVLQIGQAF